MDWCSSVLPARREAFLGALSEEERPLYECLFDLEGKEGYRWKTNPKSFTLYLEMPQRPIWMAEVEDVGHRDARSIYIFMHDVERHVNGGDELADYLARRFDQVGLLHISSSHHHHNRVIVPGTLFDIEHLNRLEEAFAEASRAIQEHGLRPSSAR